MWEVGSEEKAKGIGRRKDGGGPSFVFHLQETLPTGRSPSRKITKVRRLKQSARLYIFLLLFLGGRSGGYVKY